MEPQTVVSLASTAVAALAVAASLITTLLTVRMQRESTRSTLTAQERLAAAQDGSQRERAREQDLRDRRTAPYAALLAWADRLLHALSQMDENVKPYLTLAEWNIAPDVDLLLDLYASDTVHVRYAALRGKLMTHVERDEGPRRGQRVTWTEVDGEVLELSVEATPPLPSWAERATAVPEMMDDAIDLVAQVRAEMQGRRSRGYFVIWRLS